MSTRAVRRRLAELAERHRLPSAAPEQLKRLLDVVAQDPTAPTTVTDPGVAVDAHVADSLTGLDLPELRQARRIADLGSGGGFPGLVLAAALPDASVSLVESLSRKCAFLERAAEAMGLSNVDVVCLRAEEWRDGLGTCDAVTVRAVAPLAVLVEYAAPLLRDDGVLVAWKGVRDAGEEAGGQAAAAVVGLEEQCVLAVEPFRGADRHNLHLYSKVRPTPERFPRRAGMARKRPLSS